jgi:hypothetical protein
MISLLCLRGEKSEVNLHNSYAVRSTAPETHCYQHKAFSWPTGVGGILLSAIVEWETAFFPTRPWMGGANDCSGQDRTTKIVKVGTRVYVSP